MKSFEKSRVEVGALSWVAYSSLCHLSVVIQGEQIPGFVGPACFITECTYTSVCFCV